MMRVLVTEIEKETFLQYCKQFNINSISILETTQNGFYIEENIKNLDELIDKCNSLNDKLRFSSFLRLLLNIKKQREYDSSITDLEYIYQIGLMENLQIQYTNTNEHQKCIIGFSKIGRMHLYQETSETSEFVFCIDYEKTTFFKRKKKKTTHWNPETFWDAISDMLSFMKNDRNYFKKYGVKL